MRFSPSVMRELQEELRQLKTIRDGAIARIGALELILKRGGESSLIPPLRIDHTTTRPSLRANVLRILEVTRSSAADVARQLEADGFRVGGSTTLRERVAHEMSRLRRKGAIRRTRNGEYELARSSDKTEDPTGDPLSSKDVLTLDSMRAS